MTTPSPAVLDDLIARLEAAAKQAARIDRQLTDARYGETYESLSPDKTLYGQAAEAIRDLRQGSAS